MPEDDTEDKSNFKFLGEAYMTDDGKICLVSMDGAKFDDKMDEPEDSTEEDKETSKEGESGEQTFNQKFDKLYNESGGRFS